LSDIRIDKEGSPGLSIDEISFWLALWRVKGVGVRAYLTLLETFSSPSQVFASSIAELKHAGLSDDVAGQIKRFDFSAI